MVSFFLGVTCYSLYAQSNKDSIANYNKTIKVILKEIDCLPSLFHTIIDRPKSIEVYAGYDLLNSELIPFPNNPEKFEIIYETGSRNEIKSICFIESGLGYGDGLLEYPFHIKTI